MEKFIIQGPAKVHGAIRVAGAKNHALKVFAASILSTQPIRITNVPEIEDIFRLSDILQACGATVNHLRSGVYEISTRDVRSTTLPTTLVPKLRASILLTGPLLTRFGSVTLPHPGGCAIGKRPIDVFIHAFSAMGAKQQWQGGKYHFRASGGLRGTKYVFPVISVTGTETIMLAATLARGTMQLCNAAREPEVQALAEYLNTQGAKIAGAGTSTITIQGVRRLRAGQCSIIPDRIETLSFLFLALATRSQLQITHCQPEHIAVPLQLLHDSGAQFQVAANSLTVYPWKRLQPLHVVTREYPGFPTDGQSPLTVLLTQISGNSEVMETIYADRLFYTDMLNRMGAQISMHTPQHISIHGGKRLRGKVVDSPDLRAGIAMVIAGAVATGTTEIGNIYQIDRGYQAIDERLRTIGVDIQRLR